MNNLAAVWEQVKYLLSENISLIPVRDKSEHDEKRGVTYPAKSTWPWANNQKARFTEHQLWSAMEYRNTAAVGIVCGEVSGNLEVIDIDVKYNPGIDATLFKAIETLYPDIYKKLRIHKSPSGGYHILYKIKNAEVPGSVKLASRKTTPEEQEAEIASGKKKAAKEVSYIETRGEKGYVLAPPSMGYSVHKNNPIPILTWSERSSLITLCKSYTQIIKVVAPPKPVRSQEEMYTTNPFEDYNQKCDISMLLAENGWDELREDHQFIWFTRPGKDAGVSASWNKEKEIFFVFTSSTEFEPDKGYTPSSMLSVLQFAGDKKKTYRHLTDHGYGIFKPYYEEKKIKQAAINQSEPPANISGEARDKYEKLKTSYQEHLPHGRFWAWNDKRFEISREELYNVAFELGYRLYNGSQIVRIEDNLLHQLTDKDFYDGLKAYIWEEDKKNYTKICDSFEAFVQKSGPFTISRLRPLFKEKTLRDEALKAYKYFSNGILEITAKSKTLRSYTEMDKLIWAHKIRDRQWQDEPKKSVYTDFIVNATDGNDYVKRILGYLAHEYKSEASSYLVVLTEKTIDPKDGGGSGKNIFGNILSGTTTIKTVPGSSVKFDDKFLSAWNYESIYFLADIPKKIDWLFLKEMVTGAGYMNKKYLPEHDVPATDMPKLLINTNYSYDDLDGGIKRRIRHIEFNSFYTLKGGVDTVHGKMFPYDFSEDDWAGYDQYIVSCIQEILKANGKIEQVGLSEDGWAKKFNMKYQEPMLDFIHDHIEGWCEMGKVPNHVIANQYDRYVDDYGLQNRFRKDIGFITPAITDFCNHYGIILNKNVSVRPEGEASCRGKEFGPFTDFL